MIGPGNDEIQKIDNRETDGLLGVEDSLSYRVNEVERHFHNREKWFGLASTPSGETHRADRMGPGIAPFALISGNDAFGAWVQILGSLDTPVSSGMVKLDSHRFIVTTAGSTSMFLIQVASGESVELAAKVAAEEYTEAPFIALSNNNDSGISDIMSRRVAVGEKVWARCICIGQNAEDINLYFGVHEYEG